MGNIGTVRRILSGGFLGGRLRCKLTQRMDRKKAANGRIGTMNLMDWAT